MDLLDALRLLIVEVVLWEDLLRFLSKSLVESDQIGGRLPVLLHQHCQEFDILLNFLELLEVFINLGIYALIQDVIGLFRFGLVIDFSWWFLWLLIIDSVLWLSCRGTKIRWKVDWSALSW